MSRTVPRAWRARQQVPRGLGGPDLLIAFRPVMTSAALPNSSLAPDLAADDFSSLESFAAHVQEVVLHLRDEGHVLSSVDQHYIERWWSAGYPLEAVLNAVLDGGRKLMKRKRPPRGLPLKSLARRVEKEGGAALERTVGAGEETLVPHRSETALPLVDRLVARVDAAPPGATRDRALAALQEVQQISSSAASTFAACLAVSRRYYDDLLGGLGPAEGRRVREAARQTLGDAAARMAPDALAETLEELARRSLRQQDSLLDPTDWVADA